MRGTKRENAKNALIALLAGIVFAQNVMFETMWQAVGMGYLFGQLVWALLIVYDEMQRKRRETMWYYKKRKENAGL